MSRELGPRRLFRYAFVTALDGGSGAFVLSTLNSGVVYLLDGEQISEVSWGRNTSCPNL